MNFRPLATSPSWDLQRLVRQRSHCGGVLQLGATSGNDPLTDALVGVLAVPLRELYALLLRTGWLEVAE
ncbi:Rv1535 domain-containing protein [Mycolicibacterium sp. CBMA 226]|uniref:Rv1535 domain-containing protein n=1 Tax=Mycolicibacterium sp. CBMA 226 TaxID=2606611 RepID=UPI0037C93001